MTMQTVNLYHAQAAFCPPGTGPYTAGSIPRGAIVVIQEVHPLGKATVLYKGIAQRVSLDWLKNVQPAIL